MSDDAAVENDPEDGDDEPLNSTLDDIDAASNGEKATVGDIADRLQRRGFGPVLIALAAFLLLPTGMIPGAPALVGLMMILVGAQMLLGYRTPWMPARLRAFAISSRLINRGVAKARPMVRRMGRLVGPRLEMLATGVLPARVMALGVVASGAIIIPFGFIPFLPFVLSLPVLFFGVALSARDGVFALIGYLAFAPGAWILATQND